MFNKILVPLDGSPFGEGAIPIAVSLAKRERGSIHLVHVFAPVGEHALDDTETRIDRENARRYVAALADKLRVHTSLDVTTSIKDGRVETEILAEAERVADLVVMATHGRGGISRFWLGSVADMCVLGSETPVLLVRPDSEDLAAGATPAGVSRVVAPLDGSRLAEAALPIAEHLASTVRVPLHLVQSIPFPMGFALSYVGVDWAPTVSAETLEWANKYMDDIVAEVRSRGIEPTPHVVMDQRPAKAILDVAGEGGLVVIATHGVGGVGRALLGSVTDKVVHRATGPVLVVRPPHRGEGAPEREAGTRALGAGVGSSTRRERRKWPLVASGGM